MSETLAVLSPATISRDPKDLAQYTRFQLRRFAEEIGLLNDENTKKAFMSSSTPDMANTLAKALKELDAAGGVPAQAAPAPTPPAAAMAPQQAAAPTTGLRRQPKTNADAKQTSLPMQVPASQMGVAPVIGGDPAVTLLNSLTTIGAQLDTLTRGLEGVNKGTDGMAQQSKEVRDSVTTLCSELSKLNPFLKGINDAVVSIDKKMDVMLTLSLMMAQEVLKAGSDEVLAAAVGDSKGVGDTLQSLVNQGKGRG
jgi:hypothetical protein